jgi:hypothetical protein
MCHYRGAWLAILIPIILITDSLLTSFPFTVFPESDGSECLICEVVWSFTDESSAYNLIEWHYFSMSVVA